ncbi:Planctomycete cytochrome C [Maioricimonas rarisocia]|uniref:Planctomycete cytochrome C n=1 Tax=Maioricimonas rarisocia TaxID=2528026 RepID=A0A517Z7U5_9PLAN|nr:DUF1553 domain-containing protein [Maioricimonas rarisocia]QDU38519.1 Planctomycete cytochrome C [Maioricimonas rarisocia]
MPRLTGFTVLFLLILTAAPLPARAADDAASAVANRQAAEFFETKVRPIFARHCFECHSDETGADNGELVLETLAGISKGGSRGAVLVPKEPARSLLITAVEYDDVDLQMPPEGKMPEGDIEVLRQWVKMGGVLPEYTDKPRAAAERIDLEAGRQFWSLKPLQDVPVPDASPHNDRVRRPVDAFILARLQSEGLAPSPDADRRTLIRRVTFDLIGLPPTPEEVAAFLADDSPDAFERLVDRLLDSPHYGERWGRFWLDLARYTDRTASWLTGTGQAWHYRDWVVDAFNRNLPYDEFVRLQLAADLTDDTDPHDLAALGFLGLSPTYWKEPRLAPPLIRTIVADEWDERVDVVTRTFLGLTVACARCHDHKFDPISVEDYYSLAGVFASTQFADRPLLPDAQAQQVLAAHRQVARLEEQIKKAKDKKSEEVVQLRQQIEEIRNATPGYDAPQAHVVKDAAVYVLPDGPDRTKLDYRDGEPRDLPVFKRGNPENTSPQPVPRGFPAVLSQAEPVRFEQGSGRRELVDALFGDAAALTARVFVNRVWEQHFGKGLVTTPSNFGLQGDPPSHPELLEWLAREFLRRGWDIHWLHREIVLSSTYRQTSADNEDGLRVDPDNRLLWRMNRRRLEVEMWRDAMLAVSGELDATVGGPAVKLETDANRRRTIYGEVDRRDLNRMLRMFDFPEATGHSPKRVHTSTPLQQLFVLNSPFVQNRAGAIVNRVRDAGDLPAQVVTCYRLLFAREPTEQELALAESFLTGSTDAETRTQWKLYVHTLLGTNEFLFVD